MFVQHLTFIEKSSVFTCPYVQGAPFLNCIILNYGSTCPTFHGSACPIKIPQHREGHGAMVRAWRSADVAACRAVLNPAWCRIFREIPCFSPLNLGTLLRCCVLGHGTSPSNASLDAGENEYLVGQIWQCVR